MNIFKKLLGLGNNDTEDDIDPLFQDDDTEEGKHVVRIMVGRKEVILLLTDKEFLRAADRAQRKLNEVTIEDEGGPSAIQEEE